MCSPLPRPLQEIGRDDSHDGSTHAVECRDARTWMIGEDVPALAELTRMPGALAS